MLLINLRLSECGRRHCCHKYINFAEVYFYIYLILFSPKALIKTLLGVHAQKRVTQLTEEHTIIYFHTNLFRHTMISCIKLGNMYCINKNTIWSMSKNYIEYSVAHSISRNELSFMNFTVYWSQCFMVFHLTPHAILWWCFTKSRLCFMKYHISKTINKRFFNENSTMLSWRDTLTADWREECKK